MEFHRGEEQIVDEHMEDFRQDWTPEMEQADATIREAAPMVACMMRELKSQGLSSEDAAIKAVRWYIAS